MRPFEKVSLRSRRFKGLLWTQALGAFNDNAFKTLIALVAVASLPLEQSSRLIAAAGAAFVLPFIVFSTAAGTLADRFGKRDLIVTLKVVELILMALTAPALYARSIPALMVLLALMGVHSAFFGPVKLAILPEMLEDKDLSHGNALMQVFTFAGILLGTICAGLLAQYAGERLFLASALFVAAAALGVTASLLMADPPAAGTRRPLRWNFLGETWANLAELRAHRGVHQALMGAAYFWFLAAIFQMNLLVYGKELMGVGEAMLSLFQLLVAVGIGCGSWLAGRLSRGRVELGLVPASALGLVLFSLDLAFAFRSAPRALADLFLLGASAGAFVIPLQAFVQQRSPAGARGRFIATGNVVSFTAVLLASGALWALTSVFKLHAGQVFLVTGLMTAAVAWYILRMLPDFFLRMVFYPVAHLLYAIRARGAEALPLEGAALLVANHVSYVDAILISAAAPRPIRFLMLRSYYELPVAHWFFRMMRCIPISEGDSPGELVRSFKGAREALAAGELVCIFAEGQITRHGQMLRFKRGFNLIARGMKAPIVPVHLDRVWGSIFSHEGGRFFFKRPRRIPYPVTVSFGARLPADTTAYALRQRILELGAEAFRERLAEQPILPLAFLREAKRHPWRPAVADSSGAALSYGGLLARAALLGRAIERALPPCEAVALLLPPSAAAAAANIGVSLRGKIAANLNYTGSREAAAECVRKARAGGVVTSRRLLEKLGWEPFENTVFVEDLAARISPLRAALTAAAVWSLPARILEPLLARERRRGLDSVASYIFTSGSTGSPKGVMLTHANVLSNIEALGQLYQVRAEDRILGVLPFFHSFGHTVTLWFPLLSGFGAVYHHNPLDAKTIGRLAREHRASFLLGTPTFLAAYLKRVEPEQFSSLRYAVVGAEKLREDLARLFEERFGLPPLEGYGCTELSPVAAVNIPDFKKPGARQRGRKLGTIGQPLPGVAVKVVHPETGQELPEGQPGLLLVKGPNVMKGYLDEPEKSAAALRDGYYVTGDIGAIDEDGFITITDRLSRFSKIGGEMVPHIKVEEKLHQLAERAELTFVVTSVPDERKGERLAVLVKDFAGVDALWRRLNESDLPKLWIPAKDAFHPVAEFPLLGSGKIDLQALKATALRLANG